MEVAITVLGCDRLKSSSAAQRAFSPIISDCAFNIILVEASEGDDTPHGAFFSS
jgi:hypothetical protein